MPRDLRGPLTGRGGRLTVAAALLAAALGACAEPPPALDAIRAHACSGPLADGEALAAALGARLLSTAPYRRGQRSFGWAHRLAMAPDLQVTVTRVAPGDALRSAFVETARVGAGAGPAPTWLIALDADCAVRGGRRLIYEGGEPLRLEVLDRDLSTVVASEPVNPPVPPLDGPRSASAVRVALVDSGVDYRIPEVAAGLARDAGGGALGRDFWDLDDRPFDADARTPFFVRRHGTRTASILLDEAPVARLVPYRYPRPDMSRMAALVEDAAAKGVVIVALPLGSASRDDWRAFEAAARDHPDLLFIASAGNDDRDVDRQAVYPAALGLDNLLAVTSSEDDGARAPGSSWGLRSVHLAIPAERRTGLDFGGRSRLVSGASYAVARAAALAACLLAAEPAWRAPELRRALLERARPSPGQPYTANGFIEDPTARRRGACEPAPRDVAVVDERAWSAEQLDGTLWGSALESGAPALPTHEVRPTLVVVLGSGWAKSAVRDATARAAAVLGQCAVRIASARLLVVRAPRALHDYRVAHAERLVETLSPARPAVFFVRDSLERPAFDAVAIGRSNSAAMPALVDTVWVTAATRDPGVALAHELYHVLANTGEHDPEPANLMSTLTRGDNTRLSAAQCARLRERGRSLGLVTRVP